MDWFDDVHREKGKISAGEARRRRGLIRNVLFYLYGAAFCAAALAAVSALDWLRIRPDSDWDSVKPSAIESSVMERSGSNSASHHVAHIEYQYQYDGQTYAGGSDYPRHTLFLDLFVVYGNPLRPWESQTFALADGARRDQSAMIFVNPKAPTVSCFFGAYEKSQIRLAGALFFMAILVCGAAGGIIFWMRKSGLANEGWNMDEKKRLFNPWKGR